MARKGKMGFGKKPPKAAFPTYVTKEAGLATGGVASAASAAAAPASSAASGASSPVAARARGGSCAPMQGMTSMKRLDRPGRKRGGAVGADSSPLTSAANLSGSSTGNEKGGGY